MTWGTAHWPYPTSGLCAGLPCALFLITWEDLLSSPVGRRYPQDGCFAIEAMCVSQNRTWHRARHKQAPQISTTLA